jgi:DNA-binding GntR family transcriptional regulator
LRRGSNSIRYNTGLRWGRIVKKKEQAYELIKKAIFECKFLPGQVLNEIELAEWLGISRTPLREALAALEKDGFVNIIPNRGAFVCDITPTEVEEILDVREVLEVFAIKLATPYIPEEEIDEVCKMTEEYLQERKSTPPKCWKSTWRCTSFSWIIAATRL